MTTPSTRGGMLMDTVDTVIAYDKIAANLRDFGYPDVTTHMVREIHEAMKQGKKRFDLPHGIIGPFAETQLKEVFGDAK